MLSAVAVNAKGIATGGFYTWAKELGKLRDESDEAQRHFWESERAAVYDAWKRDA